MSNIALGDVTTQFRKWIDANAKGGAGNSIPFDTDTKMVGPLQTAVTSTRTDLTTLVRLFIAK